MEKTYTYKAPIIITEAEFNTRKAAGTLEKGREYIFSDVTTVEIIYGTTDPTTSTAANKTGFLYKNTAATSGSGLFQLKSITVGTSSTTYNWVKMISAEDYATESVAGVVKPWQIGGIRATGSGQLYIEGATENELIAQSAGARTVTASNLSMAIREGLGNNSLTWTDEYKESARETIGAGEPYNVQVGIS